MECCTEQHRLEADIYVTSAKPRMMRESTRLTKSCSIMVSVATAWFVLIARVFPEAATPELVCAGLYYVSRVSQGNRHKDRSLSTSKVHRISRTPEGGSTSPVIEVQNKSSAPH